MIEFFAQVTLADQQADPNSPLFSAKTFEELGLFVSRICYILRSRTDRISLCLRHSDLLKGLYDLGFSKPSKIQERALPLLLANP